MKELWNTYIEHSLLVYMKEKIKRNTQDLVRLEVSTENESTSAEKINQRNSEMIGIARYPINTFTLPRRNQSKH